VDLYTAPKSRSHYAPQFQSVKQMCLWLRFELFVVLYGPQCSRQTDQMSVCVACGSQEAVECSVRRGAAELSAQTHCQVC